jgi:putative membrane protein insertion efficiency factor
LNVKRVLVAVFLAPLRLYVRFISPALPRRCKYEPTCSAYAERAIRELGVVRGTILAAWRLARCNPFSDGGYDPLEARRLFREKPVAAGEGPPTHDHSHRAAA